VSLRWLSCELQARWGLGVTIQDAPQGAPQYAVSVEWGALSDISPWSLLSVFYLKLPTLSVPRNHHATVMALYLLDPNVNLSEGGPGGKVPH
jgi:hypothetical protein